VKTFYWFALVTIQLMRKREKQISPRTVQSVQANSILPLDPTLPYRCHSKRDSKFALSANAQLLHLNSWVSKSTFSGSKEPSKKKKNSGNSTNRNNSKNRTYSKEIMTEIESKFNCKQLKMGNVPIQFHFVN